MNSCSSATLRNAVPLAPLRAPHGLAHERDDWKMLGLGVAGVAVALGVGVGIAQTGPCLFVSLRCCNPDPLTA